MAGQEESCRQTWTAAREEQIHALYAALLEGNCTKLKILLTEYEVNLNHFFQDETFIKAQHKGWRPIHILCKTGDIKGLQLIASLGADIIARTFNGSTALHICCQYDHIECVKYLLKLDHSLKDVISSEGFTPLFLAVSNCHKVGKNRTYFDIVRLLVNSGCNVDQSSDLRGSPLQVAMYGKNNSEVVQFLIDSGADINAEINDSTPLIAGLNRTTMHNKTAVKLLLDAGASVNYLTKNGLCALSCAARNKTIGKDCVQYLLDAGANPNLRIVNRGHNIPLITACSPLMSAVFAENHRIARMLLDQGADVDDRNNSEQVSPLCMAVRGGSVEMVELMIEFGADVNNKTSESASPLHFAMFANNLLITQRLLQQNCNMENNRVRFPLPGIPVVYKPQTPIEIALNLEDEKNIKLLCLAGYPISTVPESLTSATQSDEELVKWLHEFCYNPRTLIHLCIVNIRKFCGSRLLNILDSLESERKLPHKFVDLILMKHLLNDNKANKHE